MTLKYRETFVVKYGNPFADEDPLSFDVDAKGTRALSTWPDTCSSEEPDYDAGLCYENCDSGYHGVGPVCWADSQGVGIGKVLTPESCEDSGYPGYTDMGLLCSKWDKQCVYWHSWGLVGCGSKGSGNYCYEWYTGCLKTGAKRLSCKSYGPGRPDQIDALCYKKCPADLPRHVPGMPYLCFKGGRGLSYGRGVGKIPPIFRFGA